MRSTTNTYKELIATNNTRTYLTKIDMTLADGTELEFTNADLWADSFEIDTATSDMASFDLGCAVIGKCKFELNNFDERYNSYDFFNATAVVWLKLDGDSSYYRMGFFTVDEPSFAGSLISLELLDNMWKFDVPLSGVNLTYNSNSTILYIISEICSYCGVILATQDFHGADFVISEAPKDSDNMNCREMMQYVAMISCNFCVIDSQGNLNIKWYDTSYVPTEDSLDGGTFNTNTTPYSDGDTADGGNFIDYTSGDSYDGGTFIDNPNMAYFTRNFATKIGTDEITITGLKVTINETEYTIGEDGYVLELDNPLITVNNVNDVLNLIWEVLENFKIRIFTVESLSDLAIEVGDSCAVMDLHGNFVYSYVTNMVFTLTKVTAMLGAVSPTRTLTKRYSKTVQTAVEQARRETEGIISDYDLSVQMMNDLAVNAMGAYQDYEDLATGGRVNYLSNMPITKTGGTCSFETGSTVFKISGDGFFVSTDGGTTWTNGYDSQTGKLVVNVLNAIGVSAEWIKTGTLDVGGNGTNAVIRVKDAQGNIICTINNTGVTMYRGLIQSADGNNYLDLTDSEVRLAAATKVGSGNSTLDDFATKANTIIDVDVEYAKNQSSTTAPTSGWSTTSPQWQAGYYIWQRTKTTDGNNQASYSDPVCIQGAKGQDGTAIASVTVTYGTSSSPSTQPSTWYNNIPTVADGDYLWVRTITDYSDTSVQDTVTYTYSRQGENGQDGTSVSVSSIKYQQGDSATTAPTGTWSNNPVSVAQGKYLWTKTTFSNGSIAYGVARQGVDGDDGVSISSVTISYGVSDSASTQPTTWQSSIPTVAEDKYLWTRAITDYTDTSMADTVTYTYAKQGKTGQAGTSVSVSSIKYQAGSSATSVPTGTWSNNPVTVPQGQYLWTKTTFSDNTVAYGVARQGEDGADGNGISSVTISYGTSSSASTQPSSWQTTIPTVADGDYLWIRTVTDYTDPNVQDTVTYTYSRQGEDGQQGQAGTSVTVSSIKYQEGTSATTAPTGTWSNNPVSVAQGNYLWTKTTFSNGSVAYGIARQGEDGTDGDDGTGISAVVEQYYLSTSNTSQTGGSWSTNQPTWTSGKYIWTRSAVTWTTGTTTYTDPVLAKAINGANETANTADTKVSSQYGTCSTGASTATKSVTLANFTLYTGARISVAFTNKNTAASAKLNVNSTGAKSIYAKGAALASTYYWNDNALVNFVYDGTNWVMEAEDQKEIFDRLTNNGETQGIYLNNNKLYVNADYIQSGKIGANYIGAGTLAIGGSDYSDNATLQIKDSSNNVVGTWTKDGITANKGSFGLLTINAGTAAAGYEDASLQLTGYRVLAQITGVSGGEWNYYFAPKTDQFENSFYPEVIAKGSVISGQTMADGTYIGYAYLYRRNFGTSDSWSYLESKSIYFNRVTTFDTYISYYDTTYEYRLYVVLENNSTKLNGRTVIFRTGAYTIASISKQGFAGNFNGTFVGKAKLSNISIADRITYNSSDVSLEIPNPSSHRNSYFGQYKIGVQSNEILTQSSSYKVRAEFDGTSTNDPTVYVGYDTANVVVNMSQIRMLMSGSYWYAQFSSSDERTKENKEILDVELSKEFIDGTKVYKFNFVNQEGKHYGVMAQEARKLLDDLGETASELEYSEGDNDILEDQRNIRYYEYVPHLINYVKDLKAEIDSLKEEIKALKGV